MRFDSLLFEYDKDFNRREEDLDALKSLTRARVEKILADAINPEKERIVDILLFAKQHNIKDTAKASIDSIDSFKTGRTFVARPERSEKKDQK